MWQTGSISWSGDRQISVEQTRGASYNRICPVESLFMAPSIIRSPHNYAHISSVTNGFVNANNNRTLVPVIIVKVTSPFRSLLPNPVDDLSSEVIHYQMC